MSQTIIVLAEYLEQSHDTDGVLSVLREKYPASIATYINNIRLNWMELDRIDPDYEKNMKQIIKSAIDSKKKQTTLKKLNEFHQMTVLDKYKLQQKLHIQSFTGDSDLDSKLRALNLFPDYIRALKVSNDERIKLQKKQETALNTKMSHAFKIDARDILNKALMILEDNKSNIFQIACVLALVSGRRMVEIFKTGDFSKVGTNTALFTGQAKKKVENEYKIPILVDFDIFEKSLQRLRITKNTEDMSNVDVNLRYSTSCNSAARKFLGEKRHFHDFRGIYALIAYHAATSHTLSMNLFVSQVLGHSAVQNSINYSCIQLLNYDDISIDFTF